MPKLTEDEKRELWNVLDQELPGEGEESPEFLAELDARVRALDHGAQTYSVDEARQMVRDRSRVLAGSYRHVRVNE